MFGYKVHSMGAGALAFVIYKTDKEIVDAKTGKINDVKWDNYHNNCQANAEHIARLSDEDEAKKVVSLLNQ